MSNTTDTREAEERAALNNLLTTPILIRAIEGALSDTWRDKRAKTTVEESALAYQHYDGACELVAKLYSKAKAKPNMTIAPKVLRHNAH